MLFFPVSLWFHRAAHPPPSLIRHPWHAPYRCQPVHPPSPELSMRSPEQKRPTWIQGFDDPWRKISQDLTVQWLMLPWWSLEHPPKKIGVVAQPRLHPWPSYHQIHEDDPNYFRYVLGGNTSWEAILQAIPKHLVKLSCREGPWDCEIVDGQNPGNPIWVATNHAPVDYHDWWVDFPKTPGKSNPSSISLSL